MITIKTYYNTSEPKTINKNLVVRNTYTGEFVDAVDVTHPTIRIEGNAITNDCNYLYIEDLDRYYFITAITSERSNITILNCKLDVLYTFKTSLLSCYGLVDRAENEDTHNRYVYDNNFVRESANAIVHEPFTGDMASLDTRLVLLTMFGTTPVTEPPTE